MGLSVPLQIGLSRPGLIPGKLGPLYLTDDAFLASLGLTFSGLVSVHDGVEIKEGPCVTRQAGADARSKPGILSSPPHQGGSSVSYIRYTRS